MSTNSPSPSPSTPPTLSTRICGSSAASLAHASPPSPKFTSAPRAKAPSPSVSANASGVSSSMNMLDLVLFWPPSVLSFSPSCLQSSGARRNGMSIEPDGSPRSNDFSDGQTSSSLSRLRSGKKRAPSAATSISMSSSSSPSPPAAGRSSPFSSWEAIALSGSSSSSSSSSLSSSATSLLRGLATSFASSLLSKMMRPCVSTIRWLSNSPLAPPSSKSANAFLYKGSTANSSSNFLSCRDANDGASGAAGGRGGGGGGGGGG